MGNGEPLDGGMDRPLACFVRLCYTLGTGQYGFHDDGPFIII